MKTKYVYAIGALFIGLMAQAQESTQNGKGVSGYLSFSAGLSFPQGDYNTSSNTIPGGFASTGGNFSISLGVTPAHFPLGFTFMGGYYFNRYDFKGYLNQQQMNDASASYSTNQANANSLFYSGFYGMGGLYKEIALGKVAFDIRGLIGEMNISTPEMSYYATQPPSSVLGPPTTTSWDVSGAKGSAFCYDLGIMARIKRFNDANVFLSLDYTRSLIPYTTTVLYTDQNGNMSSYKSQTNLLVSFFSFGIGIGYDLGQ